MPATSTRPVSYTVLANSDALPGHVARVGDVVGADLDATGAFEAIDAAGPGRYAVVDSVSFLTFWTSERPAAS